MDIQYNTDYIDLQNLLSIAKGDKKRMLKYLIQFQELIPSRIESLKSSMVTEDRKVIRQTLHQMSPQIQFFGVPNVVDPIRRLEHEYETMTIKNLKTLVNDILINLDNATKKVDLILKNHFYTPLI